MNIVVRLNQADIELFGNLTICPACNAKFQRLSRASALLFGGPAESARMTFTDKRSLLRSHRFTDFARFFARERFKAVDDDLAVLCVNLTGEARARELFTSDKCGP
jgi:hypothetical protein